jgi:hypothetical protein
MNGVTEKTMAIATFRIINSINIYKNLRSASVEFIMTLVKGL